jgi:AraC-like DNA-binding protein
MKITTSLFCIFLSLTAAIAQSEDEMEILLMQSKLELYENPDQTLQVALLALRHAKTPHFTVKAHHLIASAYHAQGNNETALMHVFDAKAILHDEEKTQLLAESEMLLGSIASKLGLYHWAASRFKHADQLISESSESDSEALHLQIRLCEAFMAADTGNIPLATALLQDIESEMEGSHTNVRVQWQKQMAGTLLKEGKIEDAEKILSIALAQQISQPDANLHRCELLLIYSQAQFEKQKHSESVEFLNEALAIAETNNHHTLRKKIHELLASNYLALNETALFQAQTLQALDAGNDSEERYYFAMNTLFRLQKAYEAQQLNAQIEVHKQIRIVLFIALAILTITLGIFALFKRNKAKHLQHMVLFMESQYAPKPESAVVKIESAKPNLVPQDAEEIILQGLERFEASTKFTSPDMSLAQLATIIDTNTKYLSEVINRQKDKNFNGYINELRVKYIIDKIQSDSAYLNYKVSYLAYEAGFASHSAFATVFKSITGMTPLAFITVIKEERTNLIEQDEA